MKNKRNKTRLLIAICLVLGIGMLLKCDNYKYNSIDEIIERKYSEFNPQYIESNNYYLVAGFKENGGSGIKEIIYKNESGEFEFFSAGVFPKMGRSKSLDNEIEGFIDFTRVYKNDADYIIWIERAWADDEVIVTDKYGEWDSIKETSIGVNLEFWFKVLPSMPEDYTVYVEIEGKREYLIDKNEIRELLD